MRLLLDTNVILDVLLNRSPWVDTAKHIWKACDTGDVTGIVVASTLTDIFYIARRLTDRETAYKAVETCLTTFDICPVDRRVLEHAYALSGADFEDNIQIACADLYSLDAIVTRNVSDFSHATVRIMTPIQWMLQHKSGK